MAPSGDPTIRGANTEENTHTQGKDKAKYVTERKKKKEGRGGEGMKGEIGEGKEGEKRTKETERGGRRERVNKRGGHTSGITTTS